MHSVRRLRIERGLNQRQLAEKAGVCQSLLSNIETGRLRIWPAIAKKLAKALGAKESDLFGNKNETRDASLPAESLVPHTNTTGGTCNVR